MIDIELAKAKGFDFGSADKFFDAAFPSNGVAADALDPNTAVPAYMTGYANPRVIEILTAPRRYREIGPEVKNGDWSTSFTSFRALELTGATTPYQDYDANGQASVNINWPVRKQYRFQTTIRIGDLEQDMNAAARVDLFAEKQRSAAVLLEQSFNDYAFHGVDGAGVYGLLNDPNLLPDITPEAGAGGTTWAQKTATEIIADIAKLMSQLYTQANGWIDDNTATTLVIAPACAAALNKVNEFGVSVKRMIADTYPNLKVVIAPEMAGASGNVALVKANEIAGNPVVEFGFTEKYKAHTIVRETSSLHQKISAGTYGAVVYYPFAIATMLGV